MYVDTTAMYVVYTYGNGSYIAYNKHTITYVQYVYVKPFLIVGIQYKCPTARVRIVCNNPRHVG
jgi:hypothetical protein